MIFFYRAGSSEPVELIVRKYWYRVLRVGLQISHAERRSHHHCIPLRILTRSILGLLPTFFQFIVHYPIYHYGLSRVASSSNRMACWWASVHRQFCRGLTRHTDQAIMSEEERLVVIRFGRDWDPDCMRQDEVLYRMLLLHPWQANPLIRLQASLIALKTLPSSMSAI